MCIRDSSSHAPRSYKSAAPARRFVQQGCAATPPPGHAALVGLRCWKADTETPRARLQLDSAFPRSSGGRSNLFPVMEESTRTATSSPFLSMSTGSKPSPVGTLLAPARALLLKASTGSAGPILSSRTIPHVRSAPSIPVERRKPGTARRASGNSTASGQINGL